MKPIDFDESNSTLLGGSAGKYGVNVGNLPTFKDGIRVASAWKASLRERLSILFYGRIWFEIRTPKTHAPIRITGTKTILSPPAPEESIDTTVDTI